MGRVVSGTTNATTGRDFVEVMERLWRRRWGAPFVLWIDLAGQFDNDEVLAWAQEHRVEIVAVARDDHSAHGLAERGGFTLKVGCYRVLREFPDADPAVVVEEMASSKNSHPSSDGASSANRAWLE